MMLGVLNAREDGAIREDVPADLEPARLSSAADAVHKSPAAVTNAATWERSAGK
jgi:hypothetical protein